MADDGQQRKEMRKGQHQQENRQHDHQDKREYSQLFAVFAADLVHELA